MIESTEFFHVELLWSTWTLPLRQSSILHFVLHRGFSEVVGVSTVSPVRGPLLYATYIYSIYMYVVYLVYIYNYIYSVCIYIYIINLNHDIYYMPTIAVIRFLGPYPMIIIRYDFARIVVWESALG